MRRLDAALPIGVKLLGPLVLIAVASNALLVRTVYGYEADRVREQFAARAFAVSHQVHTHAVLPRTAEQLAQGNYAEMQYHLDTLPASLPSLLRVDLVEVDLVEVEGESAIIRASSDHSRIGGTERDPTESRDVLRAARSLDNVGHEHSIGDASTLLAAMPFQSSGGATYVVALHVSTAERDAALAAVLRRFEIGIAPGIVLTAVVLAGGVHVLINRRLRSVLAAADGLQSGDLAARVSQGLPQNPHDEMLRLAVRFNSMAAAIEQLNAEAELRATTDELTGLFNRRFIMGTLDREVARADRSGQPLSVIMADLDGLKQINDRLGHPAGDQAIRLAADALRSALRDADYAARIGGDEIAAVLPDCDEAGLATVLARLQVACSAQVVGGGLGCTLSAGGAVLRAGDGSYTLLARADVVLYEVKRAGKDGWRIAA